MKEIIRELNTAKTDLVKRAVKEFRVDKKYNLSLWIINHLNEVFFKIFEGFEKDLISVKQADKKSTYIGRYFIKCKTDYKLSFYYQNIFLSICRKSLINWFITLPFIDKKKLKTTLFIFNQIFDQTQLFLSNSLEQACLKKHQDDLRLIKELKIVKDDLQLNLNLIYRIIKGLPVGIIVCDKDFSVLHWNPMASKITGYKQANIYRQSLLKIFTPETRNSFLDRLQKNKKGIDNLLLRIQCKTGNIIPVHISLNKLDYLYEGNIAYILSFLNLNDQETIHRQTEKIDQLSAIAALSGSIMHDIRNPINSIGLNLDVIIQLLNEQGINTKKIDDIVKIIYSQIDQLRYNLNQYLGYSKLADVHPEPIELSSRLLDLNLEMRIHCASKNIQIVYNNPQNGIEVLADWIQLRRALVNIIQNAIDASKENDRIWIKLSRRKNRVLINIVDYGTGIPDNKSKKIFEPYFSTKESGTGLGLFIAKEIINVHHGRIIWKSNRDKGTIFTVSLPLYKTEG